ncbi:MAG: gamma carbonic anhydrase family protein [Cocleimonas sp.]|nr:gamma carbonic anhydrase family protein [Cocleimonas sp.]
MTIRPFENNTPEIEASAYIDPAAFVSGQTRIGAKSSVWPMAVLRGDVNKIQVGECTNIQDGAVLHVTHIHPDIENSGSPLIIGDDVTVGHNATLHACTIEHHCLIGMNSVVLDNALIESHVIIGAGSLVPPNKTLASGYLYFGNPIKKIRPLTAQEINFLSYSATHYVKLAQRTRIDIDKNITNQ